MPLYSPESQAALPLSNTCHDSLAKFFSSKRKPYCTWLHHTRKQTHEAHRKVPVRPEVCKSCKLTPNLPTVREVCTERKEISFLYVLVKKHQVSSANQKKKLSKRARAGTTSMHKRQLHVGGQSTYQGRATSAHIPAKEQDC